MKTYKVYFYSIIAVLLAVYLYLVRVSLLMASHGSISAADFYYIAQQSYIWVYILIPFHTIFFILYTLPPLDGILKLMNTALISAKTYQERI